MVNKIPYVKFKILFKVLMFTEYADQLPEL